MKLKNIIIVVLLFFFSDNLISQINYEAFGDTSKYEVIHVGEYRLFQNLDELFTEKEGISMYLWMRAST